jgi:hypothetical protein
MAISPSYSHCGYNWVGRNCNLFAALRLHTGKASVRQVETPIHNQAKVITKESTKLTTLPNTRRHSLHALKTPLRTTVRKVR